MRLVDSVGIIMAKLLYDPSDLVILFVGTGLANKSLKSGEGELWADSGQELELTREHPVFACRRACRSRVAGLPGPSRRVRCSINVAVPLWKDHW